jgi:hypothetical protein
MNWFVCVISKQPFLEWELEKCLKLHPKCDHSIIKPTFYFAYQCNEDMQIVALPTEYDLSLKLVMGRGYINKTTGYALADISDYQKLFNKTFTPKDIDGHYIAIKIKENFAQVVLDSIGFSTVFFHEGRDSIVISNLQYYIHSMIDKNEINLCALANIGVLSTPLDKIASNNKIETLPPGATLTCKNYVINIKKSNVSFVCKDDRDILISYKHSILLQSQPNDMLYIPFENSFTSHLAFSVLHSSNKNNWGLFLSDKKFLPSKYLSELEISQLSFTKIKDFLTVNKNVSKSVSEETFNLYKNYVVMTGLSDFPPFFNLCRNIKEKKENNEIFLLSYFTEWIFSNIFEQAESLFNILKKKSLKNFKSKFILENEFYNKEFYQLLIQGAEKQFEDLCRDFSYSDTPIDLINFWIKYYFSQILAPGFAWINSFGHFYSPTMLYSLFSAHFYHRFKDKKFSSRLSEMPISLSDTIANFPKIKKNKYDYQNFSESNSLFFPSIASKIEDLIKDCQANEYYDMEKVKKIFIKAQKGHKDSIATILKWCSFEIHRLNFD